MKLKIKAQSLDVYKWTGVYEEKDVPKWLERAMAKPGDQINAVRLLSNTVFKVITLDGMATAHKGDYVARTPGGDILVINSTLVAALSAEEA